MNIHVVYEGGDYFDKNGPFAAWERVGLCIEDRVVWLYLQGPAGDNAEYRRWECIAQEIVAAVKQKGGLHAS